MLRSASLRLAALYTAAFAAAVIVLGAVTLATTRTTLSQQFDARILSELDALANEYRIEGLNGVLDAVQERDSTPGALDYGLQGPDGRPLAGRLAQARASPGWSEQRISQFGHEKIRIFTASLAGGYRLLVGGDDESIEAVDDLLAERFSLFRALALTMAVALVASFLIAWLVVPILVERLYAGAPLTPHGPPKLAGRYRAALEGAVARPVLILAAIAALAIGGGVAFVKLPSGFMPAMDEGGFVLDYITPPGTSVSESDRLMRQIEAILARTPEVATYSRRTGAQLGGGLTEPNTGDFFVRLKPQPRRDIRDVMSDVRSQVQGQVPGVDVETAQLMEDLIGDLTAVPEPIEVKLYSEDAPLLDGAARNVAARLGKVAGVTEIRNGVVVAGDAIDIRFDLARAALAGVTPSDAASQVTAMIDGDVATQVQSGGILSDVRVWIPPDQRNKVDSVGALPIKTADGHVVTLAQIADIGILRGQTELARENGRRMVAVTARVEGRDMGSAAQEASRMLSAPSALPAGVSFEMGGLYAEQQAAFAGLASVFVAAMAIVMLLLLLIYENFRIVAAIAAMPLLAAAAVGLGLILAGTELNIMALTGLTMVIGIVTEVAIFYFTEFEHLLALGQAPGRALIDAGANRLRPIAMTTLAAILALAPLAIGRSMQQPLAIAIIAGLIAQGPLVLLAMPALFKLIGGLRAASPDPIYASPEPAPQA